MCTTDGIGDDALHLMEEALDWLEMTVAALPLSWMEAIGSQLPRTRLLDNYPKEEITSGYAVIQA